MDETVRPEKGVKKKCAYDSKCTAQRRVGETGDVTHVSSVATVSLEGEILLPLILRASDIHFNT
jgi:hypothetical protein